MQAFAQLRDLPVGKIHPAPRQPRRRASKGFSEESISDLALSIKQKGLLHPITVAPHPSKSGEWQIIAGERRYRAHQVLGVPTVPCLVRASLKDAKEKWKLSLVENCNRVDLNPIERAWSYHESLNEHGMSLREISNACGVTEQTIKNYLALLKLPKEVCDAIESGVLSLGAGLNLTQHKGTQGELLRLARRLVRGDSGAAIEMERITTSVRGAAISAGHQPKTPEGIFHRVLKLQSSTRYTGPAIRRLVSLPTMEGRRLWKSLGRKEQEVFSRHIQSLRDDLELLAGQLRIFAIDEEPVSDETMAVG